MDIEGAELDILNGMKDLLDNHHPSIIIEVHPSDLVHFRDSESEIREYIRSFGYNVKDIWPQTYTKTILCKWMESE
jgi:predicted subunit of tRNA(5-methylaminomethyl-2-thiouridylate) methyltransferase